MALGGSWSVDGGSWRWVDRGSWILVLGGSCANLHNKLHDKGAYELQPPFFLCLFYCCFCCCHVRDVSGGDVITVLACFVAVAVGTHVSLVVMSRANAGSWASDSASLKKLAGLGRECLCL